MITIVSSQEYIVGQPTVLEGALPEGRFVAVFKDDGETGCFSAVDKSSTDQPIQDTVLIYNVANVTPQTKHSTVEIGWSFECLKAVLLINNYVYAVFDFRIKQGYCRSGLPPAPSTGLWSTKGHAWSSEASVFEA